MTMMFVCCENAVYLSMTTVLSEVLKQRDCCYFSWKRIPECLAQGVNKIFKKRSEKRFVGIDRANINQLFFVFLYRLTNKILSEFSNLIIWAEMWKGTLIFSEVIISVSCWSINVWTSKIRLNIFKFFEL